MKNKKIIIFVCVIIIITFFSIFRLVLKKEDYQRLGLDINEYDIDYYTVYYEDVFGKYKVYKIHNYYSIDEIKNQLEGNKLWSKNKYYEYIMSRFYEKGENELIELDRENLYYYYGKGADAIIDVKNAKLYYLKYPLTDVESDYNKLLEMKLEGYTYKEVYSIRGGWQGDGTDYYTYIFNEEEGNKISETLSKSENWSKEKLDDDILKCFKYNEEVKLVQNGCYHYKKICRTSDENKKYNFKDEEATGYELAVYDLDNNALYYYWTSY